MEGIENQIQAASSGLIAVVDSAESMQAAVDRIARLKGIEAAFLEEKNKSVGEAHALHKRLVGERDAVTRRIAELCATQQQPIAAYQAEQRRIAAEAEAERERELARIAEQMRKAKTPEKKAELRAVKEAMPIVVHDKPKAAGLSERRDPVISDIDIKKLCADVAAGILPVTAVQVMTGVLKTLARQYKWGDRINGKVVPCRSKAFKVTWETQNIVTRASRWK